jgi:hypothetical protein
MKIFCSLFFFFLLFSLDAAQENVQFTPPPGWHFADTKLLPPTVKIMVIGKGDHPFPPTMNLALQPYKGTLKQYLQQVKAINDAQGYHWKDLGIIRTEAGNGNLSQVDVRSEWGDLREMCVILLKNETIYVLRATSLKDEFARFYKDFFSAMRSLNIKLALDTTETDLFDSTPK